MPLLFSYGTLQQADVQLSTFGRLLDGESDELPGFEQSLGRIEDPGVAATSGRTHNANVTFNGRDDSRVSGVVFVVSDAELAAADRYEQNAAYHRVAVLLASGRQAWVYVDARSTVADLTVRIERLPPMRVAWVRAVSRNPEQDAWRQLSGWAKHAGLLDDPEAHPVFGFNNPSPSAGEQEYGYEFWIAVGSDTQTLNGIALKDFAGGVYAVTTCRLTGTPGVREQWRALLRWVHGSEHTWRRTTHELERIRNPLSPEKELVLDLYLPIEDE
jgi:DNA gyrase inhibitor GyrI